MHINTILEAVSSILYHMTGFGPALKIKKEDRLKGHEGGISFARSLTGKYHTDNKLIGVIYKVDGKKLNHNYKGGPVGTEDINDQGDIIYSRGRENAQLEDLVHTSEIKNFSKYVLDVYVFVPLEYIKNSSEDMFEERYADQLNHFPQVISQLWNEYGKLKFILSERDLYNKRFHDLDTAKKKIGEVLQNSFEDELSDRAKEYFGIEKDDFSDTFQIWLDVTFQCNDAECTSDYEQHSDPNIRSKNISWNKGFGYITASSEQDANMKLKSLTFDDVARVSKDDQGDSSYKGSDVISWKFDEVTDMEGHPVNDLDIHPSFSKPHYNK